jgi:hypothetical protein
MSAAATKRAIAPEVAEPSFQEQIASLAYQLWQQRGCPEGSPEEDWFRAEQELTGVLRVWALEAKSHDEGFMTGQELTG